MNENDIWLIAGLGNPEAKYDGTRHNAGFAALDALADKWNISVGKTKFQGLWGQGEVDGHKVVLLKPLTYMNLSGDSIAPMAGFFKIPADHVLVLCDDITQAPGKLRIRPSGSAGGHNGLKSIIARLGGELFQLLLDQIGALRSFVCRREAERLERFFDTPKTGGVKIGDVRRVDAYDDLFSGGDQLPDLADVADVLFCVLRADRHAVAAENAVAGNDLCVTLIDADGLDRAEPDAFVAVFAVGLFETQNIHGAPAFL